MLFVCSKNLNPFVRNCFRSSIFVYRKAEPIQIGNWNIYLCVLQILLSTDDSPLSRPHTDLFVSTNFGILSFIAKKEKTIIECRFFLNSMLRNLIYQFKPVKIFNAIPVANGKSYLHATFSHIYTQPLRTLYPSIQLQICRKFSFWNLKIDTCYRK